jgi:hypothetical protein
MKKIALLLLLMSASGFSQKTLEIYNYSTKTISVQMIATKPTSGTYPWCASVTPSPITIAPGDSYILENTANVYRFPFYSPLSSTVITNWRRVSAPIPPSQNASFVNMTSAQLWPLGNGQFFDYISFNVNSGAAGLGNIGELSFWVPSTTIANTTYHWGADYVADYPATNVIFNTIVFYDI